MTEIASIKADERRVSHLNQGHSTMSDAFSAIPLWAVTILSSNCVTARSNRITMNHSQCLGREQNDQQQCQL